MRQVLEGGLTAELDDELGYTGYAGLSGAFLRQSSTRCIAFKVVMIVQNDNGWPSYRDLDNFLQVLTELLLTIPHLHDDEQASVSSVANHPNKSLRREAGKSSHYVCDASQIFAVLKNPGKY
ncbi:MAG: hypothetical protein CVU99_06805 [Firmicutes bacterium HGW-Firmicutes-4]|nr:MAG: hypothetical protein CVU99_06805 [Firmicutes bacterium HGW-Firmicutes-4]